MTTQPSELTYPFETKPQPRELVAVAPGVFWLRMPLPFPPKHINLWLLEDEAGWTIVDTGIRNSETRDLWEQIFAQKLNRKPVTRLIVTHMHNDHLGLAAWLTERLDIELWMPSLEYFTCLAQFDEVSKPASDTGLQFYREAGFDAAALDVYRARFGPTSPFNGELPPAFHRLADNDSLRLAGQDWQVVMGNGHSPEHACLFCPALNVLIAGDQILPRISSNVSVRPVEPAANPLKDWLDSCKALKDTLPEDVLVLPSHGYPFFGAHLRLQQLIELREVTLAKLYDFCAQPQRVVDTFSTLFDRPVGSHSLVIAAGESLAHLNYLVAEGRLSVSRHADGVNRYVHC